MDGILNSWLDFLTQLNLRETVETLLDQVYREENVLPPRAEVLSLFKLINPQDVRVVSQPILRHLVTQEDLPEVRHLVKLTSC
jgi:hypothetical protein